MTKTFENYLKKGRSKLRKIALTSTSYKNIEHDLNDNNVNSNLATYGDALLKLALCEVLFKEKVKNITESKKKFESDEVLVKVIAKKYDLIKYIKYDSADKKIPQDYEYTGVKYKYIATAVEALLAAFYIDNHRDFDLVIEIVREWKHVIGNN